MGQMSRRKRKPAADPILFTPEASELARDVIVETGGDQVGEQLGVTAVEAGVAIYRFANKVPGYKGWEWTVVLASVPGSGEITVNEVSLQAGKDAALAPEWVPYEDRIRPGDLGPGDILPPKQDDERLAKWSELQEGDGFLRNPRSERTLSHAGVSEALERWRKGAFGPQSDFAQQADKACETCAFYLPFDAVENAVGVCSNEYAADGRVVQEDYGCGAHSATEPEFVGDTLGRGTREYGVYEDEGVDRW
ncbi:MAG TPA: DUF3027 domain-containing protein [Candidatus Corynebacterium gallistercoris]|uniref:DUF3027 domain-containing protein n=1 Tax=Candidatus Corynebacterium gallistercoris TaxID=2838530 RepID=A0A9D1RX91_9CORY|nr:DUF3027 domain-containing protein [Candidatus Corynebacterium gallistercoris]